MVSEHAMGGKSLGGELSWNINIMKQARIISAGTEPVCLTTALQ